ELGIVHRDVSPQNILVGSDGTSRVLDFGVAKAAGRLQSTRDGQVKGKIAYMPPEQLSGGVTSRQSDIYAASVVLWEALCGRRLFDGETEAITLVRALEGKIDLPSSLNPELSAAVDAVVMRGLARDPAARFGTAREMALAVEQSFGLASPYEVGEWVELVASDDIARRAQSIADIESAALTESARASAPRIGLAPAPAEPPHSQVSSISVSRAASSTASPTRRSTGVRIFAGIAGLLAVSGLVLGGLAAQDTMAGGSRPARVTEANQLAREPRPFLVVSPLSALTKLTAAPPATDAPVKAVFRPPPPPATKKPNPACDPPFTVDLATGRKKYKLECMK
ncbi:MAG TPA: serine/threonine-protein kinase, partial [Labilithrix sp.]|nr:serine/threonine-protein kinase [Labilithrix sp.]